MDRAPQTGAEPDVLVVDDESELADLYAAHLDGTYSVRTAYDGREAIERLTDEIDVVILDRRMPEITGDEVLAWIRERGLDCRAIMVTAARPGLDAVGMGFDEYLVKPVSSTELRDTVERLVERSGYPDRVKRYVRLAAEHATLEAHVDGSELDASDEFAALESELDALGTRLEAAGVDLPCDRPL